MAAHSFPLVQDRGMGISTQSTTTNIKFGDGYHQRINTSLVNFKESYNVSFNNRSATDIDTAVTFLKARNGVEAFNFNGEEVICQSWNVSEVHSTIKSLTATFEVVYD